MIVRTATSSDTRSRALDAWCTRAAAVPFADLDVVVQLLDEHGRRPFHLVVHNGSLRSWGEGTHTDAAFAFCIADDDVLPFLGRSLTARARDRIRLLDRDGRELPLPPLPPRSLRHTDGRHTAGATITFSLTVVDGLFGPSCHRWQVVDELVQGVKAVDVLHDHCNGEPHLRTSLRRLVDLYRGTLEVVELPEPGELTGTWTELMLLAGLFDGPLWRTGLEALVDLFAHVERVGRFLASANGSPGPGEDR